MQVIPWYRLGLYEKAMPPYLSFAEMMKAALLAQFDFIELSIDETDQRLSRLDWSLPERDRLCRNMDLFSVRLETMCLSGHRKYPLGSPDASCRQRGLLIMRKAIELAEDLGIRIIQLAGYDTYYDRSDDATKQWFVENLQKSVDLASQSGVILAFETMETPFMNTVGKTMQYVNLIHSPYLQIYPDAGNLTNAALSEGKDVLIDLATGRGHLAALHLKETSPGKFREIPYGTGHVEFGRIIETALKLGVRRFTSEFWYLGETDWLENLHKASRFLRAHFPESL